MDQCFICVAPFPTLDALKSLSILSGECKKVLSASLFNSTWGKLSYLFCFSFFSRMQYTNNLFN